MRTREEIEKHYRGLAESSKDPTGHLILETLLDIQEVLQAINRKLGYEGAK